MGTEFMKPEKRKQPFHFRAEAANYDYLCSLTRRERRSLNSCLNMLLAVLRAHGVESLGELLRILKAERDTEKVRLPKI